MRRVLEQTIGIDPRSLAALRIGLGAVLLIDLFDRSLDLTAHYTDAGVLPRSLWLQTMGAWRVSFHLMSGLAEVQAVLFALAAVFALMMLVGWRTRLATIASWLFLASLHSRNPLILNAGDQLLLLLLFWCALLPTGRVWSVDSLRRTRPVSGEERRPEVSIAAAGLLFQIAATYLVSAVLKTGPEWRRDGTAVYFALSNGHFASDWAALIVGQYTLLRALTFATMALEFVGPILAFAPARWPWVRTAVALSFMGFHLGLFVFMEIGIFPLVCMAAWLAFLPGRFWDLLSSTRAGSLLGTVAERMRNAIGARRTRAGVTATDSNHDWWRAPGEIAIQCIAGGLFAYVLFWNIATVFPEASLPPEARRPAWLLRFDQEWKMFAPYPNKQDGWLVVDAKLANGQSVDLVRGGAPLNWDRPTDFGDLYPRYRWRKYTSHIWRPTNTAYLRGYVNWLARGWNRRAPPDGQVVRANAVVAYQMLRPNYQRGPLQVRRLLSTDVRPSPLRTVDLAARRP